MKRPAQDPPRKIPRSRRARWGRRAAWTLGALLVLLVVLDFAASPIVRSATNRKLAALENYSGHVERVKVSVWRARCEVDGFAMQKRGRDGPPLAEFKTGTLQLDFLALLTGKLRGAVVVDGLQIICVKSDLPIVSKEGAPALAANKPQVWEAAFRQSSPVELTTIELKDSRICYMDHSRTPAAEIMIEQVHLVATGLLTKPTADVEMPATITATAVTPGHGQLSLRIQANPGADSPRFYVQFALKGLSLPEINPLLLNYGKIEVAKGTLSFETEITAARGTYTGYVKPRLQDLDYKIANPEHTNSLQVLARRVFAAVRSVFYRKGDVEVPTKLNISGTIEPNEDELWTTIARIVRKALSQGLREEFRDETPSNA